MLSPRSLQGTVLAVALVSGLAFPAIAGSMPAPIHRGAITYITGGIGLGEQDALETQAHNYNLAITNANKAGDFTNDTALSIRGKNGDVLYVANTGPLFYAKLPPGNYVIHASNAGQTRTHDVKVAAMGTTDLHLIWPQRG
ncbi:MAG: hypothetical protein ACREEI_11630 [Stellaceae bacterium]